MPNPKQGESEQDFVSRCMGADDMQKYDQDQRAAICYSKFREAKKSMNPVKVIQDNLKSVRKSMVQKAQEGDTRMIFGKPYEYQGGEWVQTGGNVTTDSAPDTISGDQVEDVTGTDEEAKFESYMQMLNEKTDHFANNPDARTPEMEQYLDNMADDYGLNTKDLDESEIKEGIESFIVENYGEQMLGGEDPFEESGEITYSSEEVEDARSILEREYDMLTSGMSDEEIMDTLSSYEDFDPNSDPTMKSMDVKKSLNTIHKNLAGVHDALIRNGVTTTCDDHSHSYQINRDGNGSTTGMVGENGTEHIHDIKNHEVQSAQGHTHELI